MAPLGSLPEFLKPRLRLFLSADIVGSTALKQSPRDNNMTSNEWFAIIQGFYVEAQRNFTNLWNNHANSHDASLVGPAPEFWKVIGDEIVFTKQLTHHTQLYATLAVWTLAIQAVRRWVRAKSGRLDVKTTAWTAGFPVMNNEVVVQTGAESVFSDSGDYFVESGKLLDKMYNKEEREKFIVDYIGPAIDIGFRLASHSTPRRLVISVGAAYIYSMTNQPEGMDDLKMHYAGSHPLKGVFGGAPYPIFWVDMASSDDLAVLEDKLITRTACDRDAIQKFCIKYFKENKAYTFPPFILDDGEHILKKKPDWYDEAIAALWKNYSPADNPSDSHGTEEEAEAEAPPVGTDPNPVNAEKVLTQVAAETHAQRSQRDDGSSSK